MKGKIFKSSEIISIYQNKKRNFREVIKEIGKVKLNSGGAGLYFGKCPYQVGQKIFCKETFALWFEAGLFAADCKSTDRIDWQRDMLCKWKPAQHMKQEHSRLTLLIKEIRVEKLSEISEEDAMAEGFRNGFTEVKNLGDFPFDAVDVFVKNWNATHKKPEEKFEANPWVWKIEFEVVK
jgi:hypothetical protein